MLQRILLLILWLPFLAFCGAKNPSSAELKIQNGVIDRSEYVAVQSVQRGREYCSGSFLAPTIFLTAQHCVDTTRSDCGVTVNGVRPSVCFFDRGYIRGVFTIENARRDTVLLVFSKQYKFSIPATKYVRFGPQSNYNKMTSDLLTLAGFGATTAYSGQGPIISGHGVGVAGEGQGQERRVCQNRIYSIDNYPGSKSYGLINLSNAGNPNACLPMPGDSGGPLLWRETNTGRDYIAGLASTVFYPQYGEHRAVYVATYATNVVELIEQAADWSANDVGINW